MVYGLRCKVLGHLTVSALAWATVLAVAGSGCDRSQSPPAAPPGRSIEPATYVANSNSHIAAMKPTNRVAFDHLPDALAEGYRPRKSRLPKAAPTTAPAAQKEQP